jgi:hypothetical protein
MKKLLLAALMAVSVSVSAFAQDANEVDGKALQNFESAYGGASDVEWISKENFTKASFIQNEHQVEVFYNLDGEYVATTTQIKADQLPTFVKKTIAKNYSDYSILEAFRFQADDETSYFVSAENEKEDVVFQSKGGLFSVYSRTPKT